MLFDSLALLCRKLTLAFLGERLHCNSEANVAFGLTKESPLVGRAE
jgi:hypothetical protein